MLTPRKRIRDISNITPTKRSKPSFNVEESKEGVKKLIFNTPPTPTKTKECSVYSKAKALFQRGSNSFHNGSHLVSRDTEANFLNNFFIQNIDNHTSGSLYISGPPGTGKTEQINVSFKYLTNQHRDNVKFVKLNCMSITNPETIFHEVYSKIAGTLSISFNKKKTSQDLTELLTNGCGLESVVVVLDEMDYLITKDQQVLFELFHLASPNTPSSSQLKTKLILIGISNALDLTDKFLPRLKRNGMNPEALQFMPYTSDQIRAVIVSKLRLLGDKENVGDIPLFHPAAIQLCCKKAASITGDLRKAFDLCYKSIEMVEHSTKEPSADLLTCPKVLITHVARVCANSFGDNSLTKLQNLNLLQKAILCCLYNYQNQNQSDSDFNVNNFYDFYISHSTNNIDKLLGILKKGEFLEIISALESISVITLSDKKMKSHNVFNVDIGNKTVRVNVPYNDLQRSIGDIGVLKKILNA